MNIRDVFSLFEHRAVRRWFAFLGSRQPAAQTEEPQPLQEGHRAQVSAPAQGVGERPETAAGPQAVVSLPDPEADALRLQVASLRSKIADLSARRVEMEQLIQRFEYCQYQALGDRLAENLRLRHEYQRLQARRTGSTADLEAEREAAAELDAYQRLREEGSEAVPSLAEGDQDELKRLYRAAVMRCHPDRVGEAGKAAAHDLFLRTQTAYRQNDLDGLRLIHRQLAEGGSRDEDWADNSCRDGLQQLVSDLQGQAADLILAIQTMQLDEVYRKAKRTDDWEDYFVSVRELLDAESHYLKQKVRAFHGS